MCGIAGIWAQSDPHMVGSATANMIAAMDHRGPDDNGTQVVCARGGLLALGACRLAIQDPSPAGHQPMHDEDTSNWVVFNGEIYNFPELRAELERAGVRFASHTDTEVLLRAYGAWGVACFERLRGMFAFALWDDRAQHLILGRDPLGVKPLYYTTTDGMVLFASELCALLSSGLVSRRLSHAGVVSYLALGAVQEPLTIVEGIKALPAGHYAICKYDEVDLRSHWSLGACHREEVASLNRREAVELVREGLAESVRRRLVSDVPVGIFLSGGLDSSAITAIAARQSQRRIHTVSVIFAEHEFSEKAYIDLITERYGTDHAEFCLSDGDLITLLPDCLDAMDQPTVDGMNTYAIALQARKRGLRVMLSGVGGDELFGGYPNFRRVPVLQAMRRYIPSMFRRPMAGAVLISGRDSDQARKLARWISADRSAPPLPEALLRELFSPLDRERLVSPAWTPGTNGVVPTMDRQTEDTFNAVSCFELSHYLRNVLLRDTDAMGMAHSVEVRDPFLDRDLVDLVTALPGSVKRGGRGPKPLLAGAVADGIPEAILRRRKMGFALPFAKWLRGPLGDALEETLLDQTAGGQVADVLDADAVNQVLDRFRAGSASWVRVWSIYVLKQWGERHLSSIPARDPKEVHRSPCRM